VSEVISPKLFGANRKLEITVRLAAHRSKSGNIQPAMNVGTIRQSDDHGLPEFQYFETWLAAHQQDSETCFNIDPRLLIDNSWQRVDIGGFFEDARLGDFEYLKVCRVMPYDREQIFKLPDDEMWIAYWNRLVREVTAVPASIRFGALQFLISEGADIVDDYQPPNWPQLDLAYREMHDAFYFAKLQPIRFWACPYLPGYGTDPKVAVKRGSEMLTAFLPFEKQGTPSDFPSWITVQRSDFPAWIALQLAIAKAAGISVCKFGVVNRKEPIVYLDRFDRDGSLTIPCMLALTAGKKLYGWTSYVELTEIIAAWSARPDKDLPELWRRMVFGFLADFIQPENSIVLLLKEGGWRLAPMWYVQPPGGRAKNPPNEDKALSERDEQFFYRTNSRVLNMTREVEEPSLRLAIHIAPLFRLKRSQVRAILGDMAVAIRAWENYAKHYRLTDRCALERAAKVYNTNDILVAYRCATDAKKKRVRGVGRG
jgi:hypothetical protein